MRVLVATDLSADADVAVREGAALVSSTKDELAVVRVLPRAKMLGISSGNVGAERFARPVREHVRRLIGFAPEVFVSRGTAHVEILRCAERWRADTVVVGGHGGAGLGVGSVAGRVARRARCCVLVARPTSARGWVLAATDLVEPGHVVLRAAAEEARRRRARLEIVHALGFLETEARYVLQLATPSIPDERRVHEVAWCQLAEATLAEGVDAKCLVLEGRPAASVLREADALHAELIVVGAHRRGFDRALRASVSKKVVRDARCSVLVVPRSGAT